MFQEECIDVLKVVKSRINSQHEDISSHLLLSIFKIAEVDVVYPTPPSSAISYHGPNLNIYILITIFTIIHNFKNLKSTLNFLILTLYINIVNFMSSLFDKLSNLRDVSSSNALDVVPFVKERYFFNIDFVSILENYDEFIKQKVAVVNLVTMHDALALGYAQTHITDEIVGIGEIDVNNFKVNKHIKNAVNITIFDNFNELVADIPKYFSRDVYYEIGCTDSKLFDDFCFEKIASSSYGIVKSVSLGLTLVVV